MEGLSMAMEPFLAMTAAEIRNISVFPGKIAWMACHFSPFGLGLSNLPRALPVGSLLMVDDVTPPHGHDPVFIAEQISAVVTDYQCCGVLLDFQRTGYDETREIAQHLLSALPCPVAVSDQLAKDLDCPVFLPPVPPSVPLEAHLTPWKDREIWLELGLDGEMLTVTELGCEVTPLPHPDLGAQGFLDEELCCHYQIATNEKSASFTLWRTKKNISKLVDEATRLGITTTVGLYQELR
jgi:hypothetical protein